ncbi:hypothetical protein SUGI_0738710 [Cryptomeria japonica]|nr:hypothetical protein SUGI_0738710 [Cryptomeria japonica]
METNIGFNKRTYRSQPIFDICEGSTSTPQSLRSSGKKPKIGQHLENEEEGLEYMRYPSYVSWPNNITEQPPIQNYTGKKSLGRLMISSTYEASLFPSSTTLIQMNPNKFQRLSWAKIAVKANQEQEMLGEFASYVGPFRSGDKKQETTKSREDAAAMDLGDLENLEIIPLHVMNTIKPS